MKKVVWFDGATDGSKRIKHFNAALYAANVPFHKLEGECVKIKPGNQSQKILDRLVDNPLKTVVVFTPGSLECKEFRKRLEREIASRANSKLIKFAMYGEDVERLDLDWPINDWPVTMIPSDETERNQVLKKLFGFLN